MRDWGGMLTVTGVVATLISVFFAIAAWYVQQKRRSLGSPPPQDSMYVEPLSQTQYLEEPQPVDNSLPPPVLDVAEAATQPKLMSTEPGTSLFKRYTPSGTAEAVVSSFRDDEYIWE